MTASAAGSASFSDSVQHHPRLEGGVRLTGRKKSSESGQPLITIITATYNAAEHLPAAIKAIRAQTYANFEWILIDGNSVDGTQDHFRNHEDVIAYWLSEPDRGIYDAWNKGLRLARGEWVCFLGADDQLMPDGLALLVALAQQSLAPFDFICGRVAFYRGDVLVRTIGRPWDWHRFKAFMSVAHTGALHHRSYFNHYGEFDSSFKISGDYELLLRSGPNLKAGFVDKVVARMQVGGQSNENATVFQEALRARLMHGLTTPLAGRLDAIWAEAKWRIRRFIGSV